MVLVFWKHNFNTWKSLQSTIETQWYHGLKVTAQAQVSNTPPRKCQKSVFSSWRIFWEKCEKIIRFQPRDQFSFVSELIHFCFCEHCCSYFLHRGRLSTGTANKTYHFWFQSLAPKMECTQQKFALEMTREWSFLLSLSKKWPKKIILAMCFSVPSIGLL